MLVFLLSVGDILQPDRNIRSSVLILMDVAAIMIVEKIPVIIGRKVQIKMLGLPTKMNGSVITRSIFEESWRAVSIIFDDRTTGVLIYLIKKKATLAMQLSKIPDEETIVTPVRSVKRKVRFSYVS